MKFGFNAPTAYVAIGVAIALSPACSASFNGTANPRVTTCGGHCVCQETGLCCNLAQTDCSGVRCFAAEEVPKHRGAPCSFNGDDIFPDTDRVGAARRDAGADATVDASSGEWGPR